MFATEATQELSPTVPRKRALVEGITSLGDADLLAILLGTGLAGRPVTLVAAGLLERFGGLVGLTRLGPSALAAHPGVGLIKALRVGAALELGARASSRPQSGAAVSNSSEVAAYMGPLLASIMHEEMWVLCLDGRNQVRGRRRVAQGGLHNLSVASRDVLRAAIYEGASAMLLVHNHPSGDPAPSPEDIVMTRTIAEAARVVGIPLVDHVILTPAGKYSSMLDLGVVEAP